MECAFSAVATTPPSHPVLSTACSLPSVCSQQPVNNIEEKLALQTFTWQTTGWATRRPARCYLVHICRAGAGKADGCAQDVVGDAKRRHQRHRHTAQLAAQRNDEALDGLGFGGRDVLLVPAQAWGKSEEKGLGGMARGRVGRCGGKEGGGKGRGEKYGEPM
eukprot:365712-Chlamydomonas_euryale.AAC.3